MRDKGYQASLSLTLTALLTLFSSTVAHAEYGYADPAYDPGYAAQPMHLQQASYQPTAFQAYPPQFQPQLPPDILPYVPFDPLPMQNPIQDRQSMQGFYPQTTVLPVEPMFQPMMVQPLPQSFYNAPTPTINQPHPRPQYYHSQPSFTPYRLSAERQRVIAAARKQLGIRYRWGGNTPRQGFDCSGFTKFAHKNLRIKMPRTAAQQSRASRTINRRDLKPGDMIFFKTSGRRVNHVGIYLGNGRFIHAASGGGRVTIDNLRKAYWQKRLHKYGTFLS